MTIKSKVKSLKMNKENRLFIKKKKAIKFLWVNQN